MLDLTRMERIRLTAQPRFQRLVAYALLMPNYRLPPQVRIDFEHLERLPDEPVIFALNHTDRYNYWPFQYMLWRQTGRYTGAWVKGKYFENPLIGRFMEWNNNLPTVSRGYLIARDFLTVAARRPSGDEYRALRDHVEGRVDEASARAQAPAAIFEQARDMLGRPFNPQRERYAACVNELFRQMMKRFVALNVESFEKQLNLIVFPEGTRSVRLAKGRPGLAQIALRFKKTVVPVGCNGSDLVYPGSSPIARRGRIVYRFGEPLRYEDLPPELQLDAPFEPFSPEAEVKHGATFQAFIDLVMQRIEGQLDPRHRPLAGAGDEAHDATRFV